MTSQQFHKQYPEFLHRLVVKKNNSTFWPNAVEITLWLRDTFGAKGERWRNQPAADPLYLVYWFKQEQDLVWAQLRWQ